MKLFKLLPKTRVTYWSNSQVAKWLQVLLKAPPKPEFATMDEWNSWEKMYREHHKFARWLTADFLKGLQNFVYFPYDVWSTIRYYIHNRYITKSYVIDTKLDKWESHTKSVRALYGMFSILVDYVEVSLARRQYWAEDNIGKPPARNASAGIDHLNWEIDLVKEDPTSFHQSQKATEVLALYTWWTDTRPNRSAPMVVSGAKHFFEKTRNPYLLFPDNSKLTDDDKKMKEQAIAHMYQIEDHYATEDQNMLIRLVKIMGRLHG